MVKKQYLEQIVKISESFKQYMENFKGDEARRAYLEGSRMDSPMRQQAKERKEQLDKMRKIRQDAGR